MMLKRSVIHNNVSCIKYEPHQTMITEHRYLIIVTSDEIKLTYLHIYIKFTIVLAAGLTDCQFSTGCIFHYSFYIDAVASM